ncbi:AarF/UbiB family protein [Nocardia sp. NBC_01327]|uniref:AarF/UbiB family protein n=1 Tax=Nocardia sp. NBC_01327 TaxID=2903593 RepID=UPI002E11230F|nr:hypothetical protein OG326_15845 [Nocardia sp. NBC_01327]
MIDERADKSQVNPLRNYPSGSQYALAVQNPALCFRHPELAYATPDLNSNGMPRAISGNFATVFILTSPRGKRVAIKCFTFHTDERASRYLKIAQKLASIDSTTQSQPWKMNFEYLSVGICVAGIWYPIVKMEWIEGVDLLRWIESNHTDSESVRLVAENFLSLAKDLALAGIVHGDLQHGNILVAPDRTLRLVDYDAMHVPSCDGSTNSETGHRNYQPVTRWEGPPTDFDRFSIWIIVISLFSIASDPLLWKLLHDQGGEYLLLAAEDFDDLDTSLSFSVLRCHRDPAVSALSELFVHLVTESTNILPLPVIPDDIAPDLRQTNPMHSEPLTSAKTSASTDLNAFHGRTTLEILAAVSSPLSFVALFSLSAAGVISFYMAVSYFLALFFLITAITLLLRSRREELNRIDASLKTQQLDLSSRSIAAVGIDEMERNYAQLIANESALMSELANARGPTRMRAQKEYARIEIDKNARKSAINDRLNNLNLSKRNACEKLLREQRELWARSQLGFYELSGNSVAGLNPGDKKALKCNGIHTAADFADVHISRSSALLILPDGRRVRIPGIGPKKAEELIAWRRRCESHAQSRYSGTLSATDTKKIANEFKPLEDEIKALEQKLDEDASRRQNAVNSEAKQWRTNHIADNRSKLEILRPELHEIGRNLAEKRGSVEELKHLTNAHKALLLSRSRLSFPHYVRFIHLGD